MTGLKSLNIETDRLMVEWSCKEGDGEFTICGHCEACVLSDRLYSSTQWMQKSGESSQRRFLTGILLRCQNLEILENLQSVLQVTLGKDYTYTRSRVMSSITKDETTWRRDRALDSKLLCTDMLETWEWFNKSPNWTKFNYLLGVLSLCDIHLLHMLGNLVRVLIVWEKQNFLKFRNDVKDSKSVRGSCEELEALDLQSLESWSTRRQDKDSDSDCDDPALTTIPRSSKSLSGVSRYRDFIRSLPVDIAKMILGLLDKASLYSCKHVSKHWKCLTQEILTEREVKKSVEKQAMILQGNSTSKVNPVYAKIRDVPVPISEEEKHFQHGKPFNKENCFDSVYKGIKTKTVQMEERNVYCGVYNILVLLEKEDPSRVMHYAGGQLVAVGSRDRTVRLLDITSLKEVPPVIQGHAGSVRAVLVCEDKGLVISASYDLSIRCWSLKTGVCIMLFHGHFGTINCLDWHGDRLVSGAKDCRVKVWNLQTGRCVDNVKFKHPKSITSVKINETLVISSCAGGLVRVWSIETASLIRQINSHQGAVLCLFLDQWHFLSGGSDGTVKAWNTNCNFKKCLRTFQHPKEVSTISFLFLRVITGCMDGKIRIFSFLNGDCLRVIKTNMQQGPVQSLYTHNNTVVVNTRGCILMLQFTEVEWDYSASAERDFFDRSRVFSKGSLQSTEGMARVGSSRTKHLSHHLRNLSTPSMQHAGDARQESRSLQAYQRSGASVDLQSELCSKPRSALSAGRPVSGYSQDFHASRTYTSSTGKEAYDSKNSVISQSEKAFRDRVRKRGPHHPVSLDLILLRANSSQHGHCSDQARTNMELNARVRDAWGPPQPDPSKESHHKASSSLISKTPSSRPPSHKQSTQKESKIAIPLTAHSVDQTYFTSRSPVQPETESVIYKCPKQPQRSLKVIRPGMHKIAPLNTVSQEDAEAPQRLFVRRTTMPLNCHVNAGMTKTSTQHDPLDPFRDHEAFQLRTDTQLVAFIEEQTKQQQIHNDRGDQGKTVWKQSFLSKR